MRFLLEDAAQPATNPMQWILPAVLLVLVIGIFIINYFRSKKVKEDMRQVVSSLKVGDKVKTYSGFYGTIVEISETTDGRVAVLETGEGKNKSYISIDMNAIYAIDQKKPITFDENGNVVELPAEEAIAQEKVEEKEVAPKKTTKKAPAKKAESAKKSTKSKKSE